MKRFLVCGGQLISCFCFGDQIEIVIYNDRLPIAKIRRYLIGQYLEVNENTISKFIKVCEHLAVKRKQTAQKMNTMIPTRKNKTGHFVPNATEIPKSDLPQDAHVPPINFMSGPAVSGYRFGIERKNVPPRNPESRRITS